MLKSLGCEAAWVVHGDGLDEITTTGATNVAELKDGDVRTFEITPEDAGVERATAQRLKGGDAKYNAAALRAVLGGETSAYRDIVLMNAGAALIIAGKAASLTEGVAMAADSIDSGKAAGVLETLVAVSNRSA